MTKQNGKKRNGRSKCVQSRQKHVRHKATHNKKRKTAVHAEAKKQKAKREQQILAQPPGPIINLFVMKDKNKIVVRNEAKGKQRIQELDALWFEVSRSIKAGDFEAYKATCHEDGVLVSGSKKTSYPLSKALARWKKEFDDTKAGKMKASVEFRFRQRLGDETTAHETGIFLYTATNAEGKATQAYIHFEALLLKSEKKGWKVMMEYQKSETTKEEWEKLK